MAGFQIRRRCTIPPKQTLDDILKGDQPKSMGFVETTLNDILKDVGSELKRLGVQGQMELANVLYNQAGFVPYGPGQWQKPDREGGPEHGLPEMQRDQERGGMER